MEEVSKLLQQLKTLERLINNLSPVRDLNLLSSPQQKLMIAARDNMHLARAQVQFSLGDEDAMARVEGFGLALEQLEIVHDSLMGASIHDLIDAVDIAQLSGLIDSSTEIITSLE